MQNFVEENLYAAILMARDIGKKEKIMLSTHNVKKKMRCEVKTLRLVLRYRQCFRASNPMRTFFLVM